MQTDYVRVVNPLQDENLGHEALLQLLIEAKRGDLLYCHLGSVYLVPSVPHHRERPRADLPPHHVLSDHPVPPHCLCHRRRRIRNPRLRKPDYRKRILLTTFSGFGFLQNTSTDWVRKVSKFFLFFYTNARLLLNRHFTLS